MVSKKAYLSCSSLSGRQGSKRELTSLLNSCVQGKRYKVVIVHKPKWWYSKWKKLYEIRRRR